jgi:hypothetical protein
MRPSYMEQQIQTEAPIKRAGETSKTKPLTPAGGLKVDSISQSHPADSEAAQEHSVDGSIAYRVGAMIAMILLAIGALVGWYYFP